MHFVQKSFLRILRDTVK